MTGDNDNGKALLALIDRTETLSKQVLALINLNAVLLREVAMAHSDPLEHFAKLEAEIGGLGEALAMEARNFGFLHCRTAGAKMSVRCAKKERGNRVD